MYIKTVLSEKSKYIIKCVVCLVLITVMVATAELRNEKEIIFPEIAALAVGAIAAPEQSWRTSRIRMVILIAVCSVIGIMIVRFCPLPKAVDLLIAYAVCQVIYMLSGTSFAPMISAAALPVLMGTDTIIYPLSAVSMTILTVASQYALEKAGLYYKAEFVPVGRPDKNKIVIAVIRTAVVFVMAVPMIYFGLPFAVAPPLIVAFTEFTNPTGKARSKPVKSVAILAVCALCGTVLRYLSNIVPDLPLTVSAVVTMLVVLIIMQMSGQFMPPAAALAILPMIIPQDSLIIYPAEILIGAVIFMGVSKLLFIKR